MPKHKVSNKLPPRNPLYESFIRLGAVGLFFYAIFLMISMIFVVAAAGKSNSDIAVLLPWAFFAVALSLIAQGVINLRQWKRVDRYAQRIIALGLILSPLIFLVISPMFILIGTIMPNLFFDATWSAIINSFFALLMIISVASMIWLWLLLFKKDQLVWELRGNHRTKDYKQRKAKLKENKMRGTYLILAPVVLLALFIFFLSIPMFNGLALIIGILLQLTFLPCIAAGVVILVRNK